MAKKITKKTVESDTSDRPWVSNYPPLQAWLDKIGAWCQWQSPCGEPPSDPDERYDWVPPAYVEQWVVRAGARVRVFIVLVHARKGGWEIYVPCDSPKVDETLADAERRLGIASE